MKKRKILLICALLGLMLTGIHAQTGSSDITLVSFVFQRTVLKPGADIPFAARIWNNNLTDTEVIFEIKLSDNLSLKTGSLKSSHILPQLDYTEICWTAAGPLSGTVSAEINIIVGLEDTIKAQASGVITDKYWTQKEFFLSAWSPPTDLQIAYDYYAGANFDFNLAIHFPPFTTGVNLVKANDMKCYIQIPETIPNYWTKLTGSNTIPPEITPDDLLTMDPIIELYKNEKSVEGYHLIDEPGANRFKNLERVVSYLKKKDPGRLAYINVFGITAEAWQMDSRDYYDYISRYLSEVKPEMLSFDNYHFLTDSDAPHYFQNLEIIRELALKFNLPYTNIIQLIGTEKEYLPQIPFSGWRTPTPSEHRFLVYSSLTYGFTGIIWFHWQLIWGFTSYPSEKKAEMYAAISQLNKEIKNIGDEMLKLRSVGTYHVKEVPLGAHILPAGELVTGITGNENYVVGLFKDSAQSDYFMIMNKNYNADLNTTISLKNNLSKLEFFNADTDSWVTIDNFTNSGQGSEFTMLIGAGNGILFRPVWNTVGISKVPGMDYNGFVRSYPNPFSASTTIEYKISNDEDVELSVSDILGKRVSLLEKQFKKSGIYSVNFESENLPEGIYFYTLKTKTHNQTGRMIHQK